MLKVICFIFFFSLLPRVYGQECNVYGISDGPQRLDCTFRNTKLKLRCHKGEYFLNTARVDDAFHFEVESGPVPLVFKNTTTQLTVLIESKTKISSELEQHGRVIQGRCRL